MTTNPIELIWRSVQDPRNGWSIGSFGAIGEFVRDPEEEAEVRRIGDRIEIVTARGAMRVDPQVELHPIAWDSLSGDGESWGHALAFCVPQPETGNVIKMVGPDHGAICEEDRSATLVDCGVAAGAVTMALRTRDPELIAALAEAEGQALLNTPTIMTEVLRAQPHRVLLSPAGRVEVFQPIPPADGKPPEGPHTHLLPKLIAKGRCHSANVPIPEGWQSALSMHPKSPWRTMLGERHPYDPETDAAFAPLLAQHGLPRDAAIEAEIRAQLDAGEELTWPDGRRERHKARITLRRLAANGDPRVRPWRELHDRLPLEIEEGEEP